MSLIWEGEASPPSRSKLALPAGGLVCHDLPASTAAAMDLYLRRFLREKPEQWLKDVVQLAGDTSGTILVFSSARGLRGGARYP